MSYFFTSLTPFSWMAAHITKMAIIKAMYGRTWRPWGARQVMREWFIFDLMLVAFALLVVVVVSVVVVLEAGGIVAGLLVFSVNSILTSSGSFCLVFFDVVPSVVCSQNKRNVLKVEFYFSSPPRYWKYFLPMTMPKFTFEANTAGIPEILWISVGRINNWI